MAQFKCCGVNSYSDFESSPFWVQNKSSRQIPEACCVLSDRTLIKPQDLNCPYAPSEMNSFYMKVSWTQVVVLTFEMFKTVKISIFFYHPGLSASTHGLPKDQL